MSRYVPSDYRPGDRPRSPPPPSSRFGETRRPSAASAFGNRSFDPQRNGADAPRGPRSQFDAPPRAVVAGGATSTGPSRSSSGSSYTPQLRDAPPLGSDRARAVRDRDRDLDRRDRLPSPRERSPPGRPFIRDGRDYAGPPPPPPPPRDIDTTRARRGSRDGPLSASSTYSDVPPFSSTSTRGGSFRGRGRGEADYRGRAGRRITDDRDLFRTRDRSPPPRWARDGPRDDRDLDRRDDRRIDRRDDDRRSDWPDRDRDLTRRDPLPPRLDVRGSNDSPPGATSSSSTGPHVNPERLALLESTGAADPSTRRPSTVSQAGQQTRDTRGRDQPETPSYLKGRAETFNNRYASRGSSPPAAQAPAPAVPAFTLSFTPQSAASGQATQSAQAVSVSGWRPAQEAKPQTAPAEPRQQQSSAAAPAEKPAPPAEAPTGPKSSTFTHRAGATSPPPPTAPKAPRGHESADAFSAPGANRLHGVRSWDNLSSTNPPSAPAALRNDPQSPAAVAQSKFPSINQPVSPKIPQGLRMDSVPVPTGPRATRQSPALAAVSPRPSLTSPRSESATVHAPAGFLRAQTPPPSAPSGPRNRSYSTSPKSSAVPSVPSVPTGPKASRAPPVAPRGSDGQGFNRQPDRLSAPSWIAPPQQQRPLWNQWKRPPPAFSGERIVPVKRDINGEEKDRPSQSSDAVSSPTQHRPAKSPRRSHETTKMELDAEPVQSRVNSIASHSAKQSFIGKPVEDNESGTEESEAAGEALSSSEEDELDVEDLTLFEAKFTRQKRELEAQIADLASHEYRATTPLESIARLSRISLKDVQRLSERAHEMDLDHEDQAITEDGRVPPATHSSGSEEGPDLLTPHGRDDNFVEVHETDGASQPRRVRPPSPEVIALPYLLKVPEPSFSDNAEFRETIERQETMAESVLEMLDEEDQIMADDEEDAEDDFAANYRLWRMECEELDRIQQAQEELERQQSVEPVPEPETPASAPGNLIPEGRRLHKFSSEYEIQKVLKESEETARLEQERQERETLKAQADMQKEARLPDQQSVDEVNRSLFIDNNRYRRPESLTKVFSYEPPADNFDENDQRAFIAAFKEMPKKWGKIAEALPDPNKTYKDCIHHYYANKWDGRFRDNRKKLKGGRGGRRGGGKNTPRGRGVGAMADLSTRAADYAQPVSLSESGRPKRAAAPSHFGEREAETKASLLGPSPTKKPGPSAKQDAIGDAATTGEKPTKRRKGAAEKVPRKTKATQPLATLAAAPSSSMSPGKPFIQTLPGKEDVAGAQKLEDARLLAGFQSGHAGMHTNDGQLVYHHEAYPPPVRSTPDDNDRPKHGGSQTTAKTGPSSYWSVPEQSDFVKYISHFGTDFVAIAAHMGTKTHTMIKNHYLRQIDGNRPELEEAATRANHRRERGEDMGPPPTPTPITKRKYDNPPAAPRTLAPHTEPMDVDERAKPDLHVPKHASPPQLQAQSRFSSPAQKPTVPAQRVNPAPAPVTAPTPSIPLTTAHRGIPQHRAPPMGYFSESRPESRPNFATTAQFRASQPTPPTTQPPSSGRMVHGEFMRGLVEEQDRAFRLQEQVSQQERFEPPQRPSSLRSHGSPALSNLGMPTERKSLFEDRAPTPPQRMQIPPVSSHRPMFGGSPAFGTPAAASLPPMSTSRPAFAASPPTKREEPTLTPLPPMAAAQAPPPPPPPPPPQPQPPKPADPPKRSNLLSILNDEPEEPKPEKRFSVDAGTSSAPPPYRAASPAPYGSTQPSTHLPGYAQTRRDEYARQPPGQGMFSRPPTYGQQSSIGGPIPPLKQETSSGSGPLHQSSKLDWPNRLTSQTPQPPSSNAPPLERDVRPYYAHRMSALNPSTRGNPSPPPGPLPHHGHSRTPSYGVTGPSQPPPRDSRTGMQSQAPTPSHQPSHSLHPNPYAQQPQPPPMQVQGPTHHPHGGSFGSAFGGVHSRQMSMDEVGRQAEAPPAYVRDRREQDTRRPYDDVDRREYLAATKHQHEEDHRQRQQQQQQQYGRPPHPASHASPLPPQPFHPGAFAQGHVPPPPPPPSYGQGPSTSANLGGLRETSFREGHAAALREERLQQEAMRRDREQQEAMMRREREQQEEIRRRHSVLDAQSRNTPLGGGGGYRPPAWR